VLLDNGALGKISKEQLAGAYAVWQTSLVNPTSPSTPGSAAPSASRCTTPTSSTTGMKALFAADGPALLHVHTDAELV
jgi:thiamine pyrophosphate-dependent acetolactate synthase large subunit-like protein